jgi:hypothetical protein
MDSTAVKKRGRPKGSKNKKEKKAKIENDETKPKILGDKRPRGRPPGSKKKVKDEDKDKDDKDKDKVVGNKKPRGRPPGSKNKEKGVVKKEESKVEKRPRGRPPKNPIPGSYDAKKLEIFENTCPDCGKELNEDDYHVHGDFRIITSRMVEKESKRMEEFFKNERKINSKSTLLEASKIEFMFKCPCCNMTSETVFRCTKRGCFMNRESIIFY